MPQGNMTILWIVLAAVVFLAYWRPVWALWFTILVAVLYDDRQLAESAALAGEPIWPTVYNVRVAGLQIIDWCVAVLLITAMYRAFGPQRERVIKMFRGIRWWSLPALLSVMLMPYAYSAVWGLFSGNSLYYLVQDLQNACYLLAMVFCIVMLLENPTRIRQTLGVFLTAMILKTLLLLLRYWLGIGYVWESVFRFTISSDTVLLLIVTGWGLWKLAGERMTWIAVGGWLCLTAAAFFIEFQIAGRTVMVLIALQLMAIIALLSSSRRKVFVCSLIGLLLGFSLILNLSKPQLSLFYWWRIKTIFQWRADQTGTAGQLLSNSIKVLEYKNIIKTLSLKKSELFGLGQGAYWNDQNYPIRLRRINDAYAPGETRHYSTHLQPLTQLLKTGWIGVILYWGTMSAAFYRLMQLARYSTKPNVFLEKYLLLALIPLSFNLSNYVRLYFFTGIFWGLAILTEHYSFNAHD